MDQEPASVLILLVASNAEAWLPDVIRGIRDQTYENIEVLAVDNASTDASRRLLEKAFGAAQVVSLERRVGYGRALAAGLKVAVERGASADAFLLLHDDAAMDAESVEAMRDALARERVGIVGAKLVEWNEPDQLQEVGLTIDRFGRLFNPLERGELDQGQHDGLREVLFSSSACMLVSRAVIESIGLFDLRYVAMRDDLDLCWRARVAGFRAVVTSGARVRHVAASYRALRRTPLSGNSRYYSERNMIASVLKNYSLRYLVVALPVTLAVSLLNVVLFTFTGRRRLAKQTLAALQWNFAHLPSSLRARARAQRRRKVPDREVVRFMVRGVPRVRSYVERALEQVVGEPAAGVEEAEGLVVAEQTHRRLWDRLRAHPVGLAIFALAVLYLIGVRGLFGSGGLAGADLAPFPPGGRDFFREFLSGWRSAGSGSGAPASPALVFEGTLSIVAFGSTWLAQRILFLSLLPLAAGSASRLGGAVGLAPAPRRICAMAYGLSPLALAAFSQGRLTDLVLIAALPALLVPCLRASGFASSGDWRSYAGGVLGLAIVASISPWALPAVAGSAVVLAAAALAAGTERAAAMRLGAAALAQVIAALVLLLPWSVELFRPGSPLGAGRGPFGAQVSDLVRLSPHGAEAIPGVLAWAFPVAAAGGLALAISSRDRLARTLAIAGTASVLISWGVARGLPWIAPRPGLPLTLAAVSVAMLVGLAAEGVVPTLSARSFGARHLAVGIMTAFGLAALVVGSGFVIRGNFGELQRSGQLAPAFFEADRRTLGDFRVLWVEGTLRSLRADLTGSAGETMLTFGSRRAGPGEDYLESVVASVLAHRTEHVGRLLAPLAVRYVVLRPGTGVVVARAFARQTDVRFAQRFQGSEILSNDAWLPVGGTIASPAWIRASGTAPRGAVGALVGTPVDPQRVTALQRVRPGVLEGETARDAKFVVLAETFSRGWRATTEDGVLLPRRSFGWATGFAIPAPAPSPTPRPTPKPSPTARSRGAASARPSPTPTPTAPPSLTDVSGGRPIRLAWTGQGWHRIALLVELLMLFAIGAAWSRRAARERGER